MKHFVTALVLTSLVIEVSGCGTFLYPERKGQRDGRLDVGVVALDGIGLLFFIIPGVIAYAVDYNNGTIFLPKGQSGNIERHLGSLDSDKSDMIAIHTNDLSEENIHKIVFTQTGKTISQDAKAEVYRIGADGKRIPVSL